MAESSLVVVLGGNWTTGNLQKRKHDGRNTLWPEVLECPFIANRLFEKGLSPIDGQSEASANCVMAIVEVSPGTCYTSPLTQWDKEEKVLFQFWNHPVDMYSMRVRRVCRAITHEHLLSETYDDFRGGSVISGFTAQCHLQLICYCKALLWTMGLQGDLNRTWQVY